MDYQDFDDYDEHAVPTTSVKRWCVAVVGVIAVCLVGWSFISMSSFKHIRGEGVISADFAQDKNDAVHEIALVRAGGLHFTGNLTPEYLDTFSLDLTTLATGEISGRITQSHIVAHVRGFSGHTFMFASRKFWEQVNGKLEFGDTRAMSKILARHWVEIPAGLFGMNFAADLTPNRLTVLLEEHKAIKSFDIKSGDSHINGSSGMGITLQGYVRPEYEREVVADINAQYITARSALAVVNQSMAVVPRLTNFIDWPASVETTDVHFAHCSPRKHCIIHFHEKVHGASLSYPPIRTVLVTHVMQVFHGSNLVSECTMVHRSIIDRSIPLHCNALLVNDEVIDEGTSVRHGKARKPSTVIWDQDLSVQIYPLVVASVSAPAKVRAQLDVDKKLAHNITIQKTDPEWMYTESGLHTADDNAYSRAVTGLDPHVRIIVNGYNFLGIYGIMLLTPIQTEYEPKVIVHHHVVTYSRQWARSVQALELIQMAQDQIAAIKPHTILVWTTRTATQAQALQKFLGANHIYNHGHTTSKHQKRLEKSIPIQVVPFPPY